jgi:hypothetical protein
MDWQQFQKHNNYFVLVRYRWKKTGEHQITSGSLVSYTYIYSTHHTDSKLQFRFKGTTRTYSKKNKTTVYISLVLKNCCQSISSQDKAMINLTWAIFYFAYLWAFFCHLTSTLLSIGDGVRFVLKQHFQLDFYIASSLKQQSFDVFDIDMSFTQIYILVNGGFLSPHQHIVVH